MDADRCSQSELSSLSISELCSQLGTDITRGLTEEVARQRYINDGPNEFPFLQIRGRGHRALSNVFGGCSFFLWNVALFCGGLFALTGMADVETLYVAAAALVLIALAAGKTCYRGRGTVGNSSAREGKRSTDSTMWQQLQRAVLDGRVRVIRDGHSNRMDLRGLVKGDLVEVRQGDVVPADLRMVETGVNLKVDNFFLTGQSNTELRDASNKLVVHTENEEKSALNCKQICLFAAVVMSGWGRGVVINTGHQTVMHGLMQYVVYGGCGDSFKKEVRKMKSMVKFMGSGIGAICAAFLLGVGRPSIEVVLFFCGFNIASICVYVQLQECVEMFTSQNQFVQ